MAQNTPAVEPIIKTDRGNGLVRLQVNRKLDDYYPGMLLIQPMERPLLVRNSEYVDLPQGEQYCALIQRDCGRVVYFDTPADQLELSVEPLIITDTGHEEWNVKFNPAFDRYDITVRLLQVREQPVAIKGDGSVRIRKGVGKLGVLIQRSCGRVVYYGSHTF